MEIICGNNVIFLRSNNSFKLIHSMPESINFFSSLFYVQYSKTGNFNIFGIHNNETFISQILTFLSPLVEKLSFFNPFGFEAKSDLSHKASKLT